MAADPVRMRKGVIGGSGQSGFALVGGLMRWRMQAKGYPAGQAWFWETTWVYGIGLVGFGVYLLLVWVLSWLTGTFQVQFGLFHVLVWVFFVVAHLPDLMRPQDQNAESPEPFADAERLATGEWAELESGAAMAATSLTTARPEASPVGAWHLLPAVVIAGINLGALGWSANLRTWLAGGLPQLGQGFGLTALTHLSLVAGAYLVHAVVNLIALLMAWLVAPSPARAAAVAPAVRHAPPTSRTAPLQPAEDVVAPPKALPKAPPVRSRETRKISFRKLRARSSPGPIGLLVDHLKTLPEEELKPVLRLIGAVATGDPRRLDTPLVADTTHHVVCHRDGSLDAAVLASFLRHLPRIREFVPRTAHGTKMYRPAARRLASALARSRMPEWKDWLTGSNPGVRQLAGLIQAAPVDQPIVLYCGGAAGQPWAPVLVRILDDYLGRCALRRRIQVACGVPAAVADSQLESAMPDPVPQPGEIDAALTEAGVRAPGAAACPLGAGEAAAATAILLASFELDPAMGAIPRSWLPGDASLWEKVIPMSAFDPALSGQDRLRASPARGPVSAREWVHAAATLVLDIIIPILQTKAGEFSGTATAPVGRWEPPRSSADRARVEVFRESLMRQEDGNSVDSGGRRAERVLRLLWALAHRDSSMLIHPGLAPELADRIASGHLLDDEWLWACLRNASCLGDLIPPNRARKYGPLASWLEHCLELSAAST